MNPTIRKLAFTLPPLLAAGLLVVMFQTARGAASFQRGAPLSAQVLYVDADASGAATGLSWTDAYTYLQDALAAASSGNEVWVAEGVYYPDEGAGQTDDDREATFQLTDSVELYGGFAATETLREQRDWEAHVSVLSGDLDQNDATDPNGVVTDTANIAGSNAYHVVAGSGTDATAVLDGFTITAGQANGAWVDPCGPICGGGMYNDGGSPTLDNVTFSGNTAGYGSGMYNTFSSPTLTGVTFSSNEATDVGGGMFNYVSSPTLTDVTFSGNAANDGGGMANWYSSSPILTDVSFSGNTADEGGGGMSNQYSSSPILTNVNFSDNAAIGFGGGINNSSGSSPILTNVSFSGNAASGGGGMRNDSGSSPTLDNVTFSGNTAGYEDGGGMLNTSSSNPTLTNVSFSGNAAVFAGGGMKNYESSPTLTNVDFSTNDGGLHGGGMYNACGSSPALTNVTFFGNSAGSGGGMHNKSGSSPTLDNVSFSSNSAQFGGGMDNYESSPTLSNVTFSGNTAAGGGGMFNQSDSSPTLTNVSFSGNEAGTEGGGGMFNTYDSNPTLTNVIFSGNATYWGGGGIYNTSASSPTLTNVTFSGNAAYIGGGIYNYESSPAIRNSILWDNQDIGGTDGSAQIHNSGGSIPLISHSLVMSSGGSGPWWDSELGTDGGGNLDADPLFVTPVDPNDAPTTGGNLRLQEDSPAIDAGDDSYVTVPTDLDGHPRIVGDAVDMGAYEHQKLLYLPLIVR